MGVSNPLYIKYLEAREKYFTHEMELLEIGDQDIIFGENSGRKMRDIEKSFYQKWETIDLHQREGVTIRDLSVEKEESYSWDIVSNFGTSEHVEPEEGHYICWKNIHKWTKLGGYSIHEIPESGSWKNHCRFYYDLNFFRSFESVGYEIIDLCQINYKGNGNLVFCLMKKNEERDFFSTEIFKGIIKIEEGVSSTTIAAENNPKGLVF